MRISCTTLESFRLWSKPEQDWMPEEELQATIRGEFRGNHKVWLGQAFGAVLEYPDRYRVPGGYRVANLHGCPDTFELGDDVMGPVLALIPWSETVFEAKGVKAYHGHDVVAKADQMVGTRIIETKATLSSFDFDKYAESCQWRFMLDIFQAASVTYHVACLSESEATGVISLRGIETFTLYPYAALSADLDHLVGDFEAYVTARGLVDVLNKRQQEAA